jgi:hypothetical protein
MKIEILQKRIEALLPKNAKCRVDPLMHPDTGEIYVSFYWGRPENRPYYVGRGMTDFDATDDQLVAFVKSISMELVSDTHPAIVRLGELF